MAPERKRGRGVEGWSGGWEKRRRGSVGGWEKRKYCCVLLESGGYHGDGRMTERDGKDCQYTHTHTNKRVHKPN